MKSICRAILGISSVAAVVAQAGERLPAIPPGQYNQEQKQAAADFEAARKAPLTGPFNVMMYSPQVMSRARAMGDYLRYHSAIGNTLSELVILMTARDWSQGYEWWSHYPIAVRAGIRQEIVDAIGAGKRPAAMSPDETIVYDYVNELLSKKKVSDATFNRAKARFGPKGLVDITGIVGYYTLLAMQLNAAQFPAPKDAYRLPTIPH